MFAEPRSLQLVVGRVQDITPRMREISFALPASDGFTPLPGQDVSLGFITGDGSAVRRRYSIRRFSLERGFLDIDVVMHGDGPGRRWAERAAAGGVIDAIAPRGKITIAPEAAWHLFAGDATAIPAAFAMMEALPERVAAFGFFLVDDANECQPLGDGRRPIEWRYQSAERGGAQALTAAISETTLPSEIGHAYLAGEVSLVSALKSALLDRGWSRDAISSKAYWNRGRANAGHGEPEQKAS